MWKRNLFLLEVYKTGTLETRDGAFLNKEILKQPPPHPNPGWKQTLKAHIHANASTKPRGSLCDSRHDNVHGSSGLKWKIADIFICRFFLVEKHLYIKIVDHIHLLWILPCLPHYRDGVGYRETYYLGRKCRGIKGSRDLGIQGPRLQGSIFRNHTWKASC